ncbi:MAG TPA: dihydroorotate dehydrogenase [Acidimicrobiales bacterium]|nr:dihydroorotate dehydrogenase [Acidimicrobiales bacterium]
MSARVGALTLPNPVLTAAGTSGHGAELSAFFDLSSLGAVVVKSISAQPWGGNAAPRVHEADFGMLNSVGLQNPGVGDWLAEEVPALVTSGARVVASIWGRAVDDYATVASALRDAPAAVIAVEVNLSCPNLDGGRHMFAHSTSATSEAISASLGCGRPVWAKLSPNVADITEIAGAAISAGASALTLVNTVMGMAIDTETRRPILGAGTGGLSGPAIRPVAVRALRECHLAFPDVSLVGVGGVSRGEHAVELLLAGASAVQVGTATFADPRAPARVLAELRDWCIRHDVTAVSQLVGSVYGAS